MQGSQLRNTCAKLIVCSDFPTRSKQWCASYRMGHLQRFFSDRPMVEGPYLGAGVRLVT